MRTNSNVLKIIVLALLFAQLGCTYQTISKEDVKRADKFCEDSGGVENLTISAPDRAYVRCTCEDGTRLKFMLTKYMNNEITRHGEY